MHVDATRATLFRRVDKHPKTRFVSVFTSVVWLPKEADFASLKDVMLIRYPVSAKL